MKISLTRLITVVVLVSLWTAAPAQAQIFGQTKSGAYYTIAVPEVWNGTLVIWNHGYDFSPIAPEPSLGPLAAVQLSEGYAVAASSYRQNQWAVFDTADDLEELGKAFIQHVGKPNSVILTGASLGGIVTADALERSHIPRIAGAFAFCGAMAGSRVWDGAQDIRLTYDVICSDVAPIPGGATGLPEVPGVIDPTAVAIATNICMGTLLPPVLRTPEQQANMDQFLAATMLPENFIITDMVFGTNGLANLIFDERKLHGRQGVGNKGVKYLEREVNAKIERVKVDKRAAHRLRKNFTPRGRVRDDMKIISIHTDKDGLVIVENESEYQKVVKPENLTVAIAVEDVPTHCGFSTAEVAAGWESLRGWIAGAPQPNAAVLQGTCQFIEASGSPGPCRYDPTYVIGDMDDRIPPRDNARKKKKRHHH
jgi:pimeloyl-ACP methyl ester carboxylesterase